MAPEQANGAIHFATGQDFRSWLAHNHDKGGELWIGFDKKSAKKQGTSYAEALDEALCYGWIDGVRYAIDAQSYKIRFTARRPTSVWSLVNLRHVERLKKLGKMAEPGLKAYEARQQHPTGIYSFEQKGSGLTAKRKKIISHQSGRVEVLETQQRRLAQLIADSAAGRRINRLNPKAKRT
jgi:uncharacterized protein YdeI (YjbR/CyaY-like superfamily)